MTALLSEAARRLKARCLLADLDPASRILEVGSGDGWMAARLRGRGYSHVTTIDLLAPADVVGDVREWRSLGLAPGGFDAIIAFEVVEHIDCWRTFEELLAPEGRVFVTTPVPEWDWLCERLERLGLSQQRTSPHDHLVDVRRVPLFEPERYRRVAGIAQWAVLRKRGARAAALHAAG
ncbi:MAG: methyltransferase domain-containing protein [Elusimicrobia bacterium]|nr:methyltransferase domain-containing protein [Elusimicrobiota bacterium]